VEIKHPSIHPKSWGFEAWIENIPEYCGKILVFRAGGHTSMHYHRQKMETLYLRKGKMIVRFEDEAVPLAVGDALKIEPYTLHRLEAIEESELIEVSTQHFEEDSVRVPIEPHRVPALAHHDKTP